MTRHSLRELHSSCSFPACDVRPQEAAEFAAENELFYVETSAKDSSNVTELFTEIGAVPCAQK